MFDAGPFGSVGGVLAGSVKLPSGAIQSRNTSSSRNTTRTFAGPALRVYVALSAANPVTSPSVVPAARAGAAEHTSAPARRDRAITERFIRTKMLTSASLHASMNKMASLKLTRGRLSSDRGSLSSDPGCGTLASPLRRLPEIPRGAVRVLGRRTLVNVPGGPVWWDHDVPGRQDVGHFLKPGTRRRGVTGYRAFRNALPSAVLCPGQGRSVC